MQNFTDTTNSKIPSRHPQSHPAATKPDDEMTVTFHMVQTGIHRKNDATELGSLFDDGPPYCGLGKLELQQLFHDTVCDWNLILENIPECLNNRAYWQYGCGSHSSELRKILGSMFISFTSDQNTVITIPDLVIEWSSPWLIGSNFTSHADIIHTGGNVLRITSNSALPVTVSIVDHKNHIYFPKQTLCPTKILSSHSREITNIMKSLSARSANLKWPEKQKIIDKVHKHVCGHSTYADMKIVLQKNKLWDEQCGRYLKTKTESCEHCILFRPPEGSRKVSLGSLSRNFNDITCIDHLFLDQLAVCHSMDSVTRYSAGAVVDWPNMENLITVLDAHCISPFWSPNSIVG